MSSNWITRALSKIAQKAESDAALLEKEAVILMQGQSVFGDKIYSYLKLTIGKLNELNKKIQAGEGFKPSDFGTVIAAGKGEPADELKAEMAVTYNLVELPKPKPPKPIPSYQPKVWGEED